MPTISNIKIAAITDDGHTISKHFGRAAYYLVVAVENGQVVSRELRNKLGHVHFKDEGHSEVPGQPHGMDADSHAKHLRMAQAIADCTVALCGGMGRGAYESLKAAGVQPMLTDIEVIDLAVSTYLAGNLVDQVEMLH